jgi:hypothetical protein
VLECCFALLHRQADRGALTADGWGTLPLSDGWREATPFLTAGATLPLSDGWREATPFLTAGATQPVPDGWLTTPNRGAAA